MRHWLFALIACWALSSQAASPVRDLTLAFDDFYTRTADQPMAERVVEFRRTIGAQFPQFYGDERGAWTAAEQDARITAAIKAYPALRDAYLKKARGPITATCTCPAVTSTEKQDLEVHAELTNEAGEVVARAHARWRVGA